MTVYRRKDGFPVDIHDQAIQEIKSAPPPGFSIWLDKSTDIAYGSRLMVYVMAVF